MPGTAEWREELARKIALADSRSGFLWGVVAATLTAAWLLLGAIHADLERASLVAWVILAGSALDAAVGTSISTALTRAARPRTRVRLLPLQAAALQSLIQKYGVPKSARAVVLPTVGNALAICGAAWFLVANSSGFHHLLAWLLAINATLGAVGGIGMYVSMRRVLKALFSSPMEPKSTTGRQAFEIVAKIAPAANAVALFVVLWLIPANVDWFTAVAGALAWALLLFGLDVLAELYADGSRRMLEELHHETFAGRFTGDEVEVAWELIEACRLHHIQPTASMRDVMQAFPRNGPSVDGDAPSRADSPAA